MKSGRQRMQAAFGSKGQIRMTDRKMYMAEACAGFLEKYSDEKKDKAGRIRWLISELILLVMLIAAGTAWFQYTVSCKGNYAVSSIPEAAANQQAEDVPDPWNGAGIEKELFAETFLEQEESYYAGPAGDLVKEPGEITVVLDPGHGGVDEGCARGGVREKEVNLSIALRVRERLKKLGYQVVMTRDADESMSLGERIQAGEEARGDIYVSIHQNSSNLSKVNGLEIYYSAQNAESDSKRLSELIHQDVLSNTGAKARSIFEWEEIRVIREAEMPACLIETGFLTNAAERRRLADPSYQDQMADGIAAGIDRYFHPKVLYLTFEAGVPEKNTKTMLAALKEQNIRAVFFVTGKTAEGDPETVRRITEAGHSIGIYENWEDYRTVYTDVDHYLDALKEAYRKVQNASGEAPVLFSSNMSGGTAGKGISSDTMKKIKECGFFSYEWKPAL